MISSRLQKKSRVIYPARKYHSVLTNMKIGIKFRVTYDSIEKLNTGTVTELETHKDIYPIMPKENAQLLMATFGRFFHDGVFDLKPEKTLNQVFPEIKVSSVRDVLQKAWGNH